jgi:hypothetical protein
MPPKATPALAFGVAAALGAFVIHRSWLSSRDDDHAAHSAVSAGSSAPRISTLIDLPLTDLESGFLVVPSIATISFYDGAPPAALPKRVREILEANPFLRARLSPLGDNSGRVSAAYLVPAAGESLDISPYYENIAAAGGLVPPGLRRDAPYSDMVAAAQRYIIGPGAAQLGNGGPLYKVTLLNFDGSFALLVSMSHILGDGSTFYRLHNMLAPDMAVGALDRSLIDISREASSVLGAAEASFLESDAVAQSFRLNVVQPACSHLAWVNQEAIQRRKEEEAARGCKFNLSTNDILTSAFFEASGCDVGCMAMNLRGRLPGVNIEHSAGNYETTIPYMPPDFHPSAIRHSVRGPRRYQRPSATLSLADEQALLSSICSGSRASTAHPGALPGSEVLTAGRLSVVSNLASFYSPESMRIGEECRLSLHLVLRPTNAVAWRDSLFVFRSTGRIGVVCAGRGVCSSVEALRSSPFGQYLESSGWQ